MVNVTFDPLGTSVVVERGTTILQAARDAGILIESPCNSIGTCGKCRVRLDRDSAAGVQSSFGRHRLSLADELDGFVLACQTRVFGDIRVQLQGDEREQGLKIVEDGAGSNCKIDAFIMKKYQAATDSTAILSGATLLGTEEGNTESANYGVVVDIGTTTLVVSLVDLITGEEKSSASRLNPQSLHAQDVLSRIKYASEPAGLEFMYSRLIAEINEMIGDATKKAGVRHDRIYEVIFSGNTCMLHLATGTGPRSLGKYPYEAALSGGEHRSALEHGLNISEYGIIYLPPIIASFVGADITSGVLASRLHERDGVVLFVDIGTNGEVVLSKNGSLSATSTAAGPAFEGMNIACGMRASDGAIEEFEIDESGVPSIKVIGDVKPVGICGSGLLDAVAELIRNKVISKAGRFVRPDRQDLPVSLRERMIVVDGKSAFLLADRVYLSQEDVRQVQLAKGAVRAGIEMLLRSLDVSASEMDEVLIAGSFGYHLKEKSLIGIGLLPVELEGKVEFLGNTSKSGGRIFLLDQSSRREMETLVQSVSVVELTKDEGFDKVFVGCLGF